MSLYDAVSLYDAKPIAISNHYTSALIKDVLSFQYETIQQWYRHFFPYACAFSDKVAVDIIENEFLFKVIADLPGGSVKDIDISLIGRDIHLTVSANAVTLYEGDHYMLHERPSGPFQRTIRLPEDADMDNATATFARGLLVIEVPKLSDSQREGARQLAVLAWEEHEKALPVNAIA